MKHPRKLSMNQHNEFVLCREKGSSKAGRYIVLSTLENKDLEESKFAYITTKKVGKAHQRNAIRRKLRMISQKYGDRIISKRYTVIIARYKAASATFAELEKDWLRLAKKMELLEDDGE